MRIAMPQSLPGPKPAHASSYSKATIGVVWSLFLPHYQKQRSTTNATLNPARLTIASLRFAMLRQIMPRAYSQLGSAAASAAARMPTLSRARVLAPTTNNSY